MLTFSRGPDSRAWRPDAPKKDSALPVSAFLVVRSPLWAIAVGYSVTAALTIYPILAILAFVVPSATIFADVFVFPSVYTIFCHCHSFEHHYCLFLF